MSAVHESLENELWTAAQTTRQALDYADQEWVSGLLARAAKRIEHLKEEGEVHKKRVSQQRSHLARLEKDRDPVPEPEVAVEEVEERQRAYVEKVNRAEAAGDVTWLAQELVDCDREKQVLVAKLVHQREALRGLKKMSSERKGAHQALDKLQKELQKVQPDLDERLRVNVGLIAENTELKRQLREVHGG